MTSSVTPSQHHTTQPSPPPPPSSSSLHPEIKGVDSPSEDDHNVKKKILSRVNAVASCLVFSLVSVAMVLINKYITLSVPSSLRDQMPNVFVVWFQCLFAVLLLHLLSLAGTVDLPVLDWPTVKHWLPINLLFIGMLLTSFLSFVYLNVPMITIIKNLTNVFTVSGDYYFFKEEVSLYTVVSIVLMIIGAVMAGINDLEFSFIGYFWVGMNTFFTASYILYMRHVTTTSSVKLSKIAMVYYNNVLSSVLMFPLFLLSGDVHSLTNPLIFNPNFLHLNAISGALGLGLNFSSLWCVGASGATTYAVVGSLCKVPVTALGFLLFDTALTRQGMVFVVFGTIGGLLYGWSKLPKVSLSYPSNAFLCVPCASV
eukprot:gene11467-12826_t